MPSDDYQAAIGRRLRLPLADDSRACPACDLPVDKFGDHHLICAKSATSGAVSRNMRHNNVRDHVHNPVVKNAQLSARIEPEGLVPDTHSRANHDRPTDVFSTPRSRAAHPGRKRRRSTLTSRSSPPTPRRSRARGGRLRRARNTRNAASGRNASPT